MLPITSQEQVADIFTNILFLVNKNFLFSLRFHLFLLSFLCLGSISAHYLGYELHFASVMEFDLKLSHIWISIGTLTEVDNYD
jgi:hypothetical protein